MNQPSSDELPTLELFRDRIKFALERANMSQSELGRCIGTSPQNVQNMTTRKGLTYRGARLFRMAEVLEVPAEWLGGDKTVVNSREKAKSPESSRSPVSLLDTSNLSALQVAGLEALTTLMRGGDFSDEEVIDLLAELKPRLKKLKSA